MLMKGIHFKVIRIGNGLDIQIWTRLVTGVYLSRRPFVNGGLIILTPTGDRNGSHVRSKIDIDLFIVFDYWKMYLVSADTMMLEMECQKDCLLDSILTYYYVQNNRSIYPIVWDRKSSYDKISAW